MGFTKLTAEQWAIRKAESKERRREARRVWAVQERARDPEKVRERVRRSYEKNSEKNKERRRQQYQGNLDHVRALKRERQKRYRAKHPEKVRAILRANYLANHEKRKADALRYQSENRGTTVKAIRNNYRAKKRAAPGRVTKAIVIAIRAEQGDKCVYCPSDLNGGGHLDHKKPISKGGTNLRENLQLTCPTCNLRKAAKDHEVFLAEAV